MLTLLLAASLILQAPDAIQPKAEATKASDKPKADANASPEGALRGFLGAMLDGDETKLRAVALPHEDFDVLLGGQPIPKLRAAIAKGLIARQPIKALKPGEEWTLPRGRVVKVTDEDVNDDHALLLPQGQPIPFRCTKVDGHWRVDASSVIAGRKAARKAVEAKEKDEGPGEAAPEAGAKAAEGEPLVVPGSFRIDSIGKGYAWHDQPLESKGRKSKVYFCTSDDSSLYASLTTAAGIPAVEARRADALRGYFVKLHEGIKESGFTNVKVTQHPDTPPIPDRVFSKISATTPDGRRVHIGNALVFGKEFYTLNVIGDTEEDADRIRALAESLKDGVIDK
ncbi:hypothetical protein EP7_002580 [Isosphaeraceae bacterium EP7]